MQVVKQLGLADCLISKAMKLQTQILHPSIREVAAHFMHHLLERVAIPQATSPMIVTTMQIILSEVSLVVMDNHFSATTT
jgi:hypothetical protein